MATSREIRWFWQMILVLAGGLLLPGAAQAGLTMEMDLILGDQTYSFSPNLGTNATAPAVPFGTYHVTSPGWPTNGADALYFCDSNGFNQTGGGSYGFSSFDAPDFNDSFIQNLTNGLWSIFVTNAVVTNVYYFTVTSNIGSNALPPVVILYPPNNALNVTNQPTFLWEGPTNYDDLILYQDANSTYLPVTQTSYAGFTAAPGLDGVNAHYDLYSSDAVVCSVPRDSGGHTLSSWVSTAHLQDFADAQFTVGGPAANFNAALGTSDLPWATMGDAAWFTETTNTYNGATAAAQSGSVTGSQSSTLSVIVNGPGTLTYYWSSIANDPNTGFSYEFDVDGNYSNNITGDTTWYQDGPYAIGPGQHTLTWTAYANGDTDPTQAGFLDQVSYIQAASPTLTVTDAPTSGVAPLTVQFTSPGVDSFGDSVTNWHWSFGDGGTSTAQSPAHTYTNTGSYFPSLTAYSTSGSTPLSVTGPGTITVTIPSLDITTTPSSGAAPLTVQFYSPGVDSTGDTVTNWNWNFGDGGTSQTQNPTHVYAGVGSYSPTLAARSTYGSAPLAVTGLGVISVYASSFPAFRTVYTFSPTFGSGPNGDLALAGNTLYGTTYHGGSNGIGTVFAVNVDGTRFTNLYNLSSTNGGYPVGGLISAGGELYGVGATVFGISTNGAGYTNLLTFGFAINSLTGYEPESSLALAGNSLYGTTWYGGASDRGTIFYVSTNGASSGALHNFSTPTYNSNSYEINYDGIFPSGRLLAVGGTLYGTTERAGNNGSGTIFSVITNQPGSFTVLHSFAAVNPVNLTNSEGAFSFAGLVLAGTNLYGTTYGGGTHADGAVFALSTNGLFFTNLYSFTGGGDGSGPHAGLTLSGHTLYGTTVGGGAYTNGTLFAINTDGSGFTNLYSFTGGADGANPQSDLILSGNTLYGTAPAGGSSGDGTVFSFALPQLHPLLAIARSGTNVVLTWSTTAAGYYLEFATNLVPSAVWNTNLPAPILVSGLNTVTNGISASSRYYRLSQ